MCATVVAGCSNEGGGSDDAPDPVSQSESKEGLHVGNLLNVSNVAAATIRFGVSN